MGVGGHRSRDRRVRREHPAGLVEHPWTPRLPRHRPTVDHRGQRWRQRQPAPHLEDRTCRPGRRDRPGHQRLPPTSGPSKWNKIEHRLFSQITLNWRGRPLTSHQIIVDLIGATSTATGLTVRAELDTRTYPTGIRYTKKQVDALPIIRQDFHGEWNYCVSPPPTDTPTLT